MVEIKTVLNEKGRGSFLLMEDGKQMGEMMIGITGTHIIAFHTEVAPEAEGKGFGRQLLNTMVEYAREHHLKVKPLCPYVYAQFKRHPEEYADLWTPSPEDGQGTDGHIDEQV